MNSQAATGILDSLNSVTSTFDGANLKQRHRDVELDIERRADDHATLRTRFPCSIPVGTCCVYRF